MNVTTNEFGKFLTTYKGDMNPTAVHTAFKGKKDKDFKQKVKEGKTPFSQTSERIKMIPNGNNPILSTDDYPVPYPLKKARVLVRRKSGLTVKWVKLQLKKRGYATT